MQQNRIKLSPAIINGLRSDKEQENFSAIHKLRDSGKPEYIPHIIDLLCHTRHSTIKAEIYKLLSELKQNASVPYLIEAILDDKNTPVRRGIIETCWQNGLKYAQYLPVFIDLIISEDDQVAFEAFTVIENMEYIPEKEIVAEQIEKANQHLGEVSETKQYFLNEIIKFLQNW
ncbi:MAG: HEAT repeat domain-containing protein [Chlorobi bacterium]|nr:HEAT repeat domain-containing protein [Chlorobiota bacterium]